MTILSDAPFFWPLRNGIALQNGSGSPTFTRATLKWVYDENNRLIPLRAGAIEMRGARCAQNWLLQHATPVTSSENFANAKVVNCTLSYSGGIVTATNGPGALNYFRLYTATSEDAITGITIGSKVYVAVKARGVGASIGKKIYILSNATGDLQTPISFTLTADWQTIFFDRPIKTTSNAEYQYVCLVDGSYANVPNGSIVEFKELQVSPYVCEYVSVGVLAAPYHDAGGVDGVKYFDTYTDGTYIPASNLLGASLNPAAVTNTLLHSRNFVTGSYLGKWIPSTTGSELLTNGDFGDSTAWTLSAGATIAGGNLTLTTTSTTDATASQPITCIVGEAYTVTINYTTIPGSSALIRVGTSPGSGPQLNVIPTASVGQQSFTFIAAVTTQY